MLHTQCPTEEQRTLLLTLLLLDTDTSVSDSVLEDVAAEVTDFAIYVTQTLVVYDSLPQLIVADVTDAALCHKHW